MVSYKSFCSFAVAILLMLASSSAFAGGVHNGVVLETIAGGGYTYMEINESGNKFWIAGPQSSIKKGTKVNFSEQVWMNNFESKALNRTFDKLLFVDSVRTGVAADVPAAPSSLRMNASSAPPTKPASVFSDKPAKKYTVEEIFTKKTELNGQIIKIVGKVVKVSKGIMGRNWVHVEDGTGFPGSNKVVFRSVSGIADVGDSVTATGRLEIDKDFGMGYFYPVIVEDSTFMK